MEGLIANALIHVNGSSVEFGTRKLSLENCPLTLRLFKFMAASPTQTRARNEVLKEIYGTSLEDCSSDRLARSNRHNLVKLISRSRSIAKSKLTDPKTGRLRWFSYDHEDDAWTLVVTKNGNIH